jgi:hypothetical protein
MTAIRMIVTCCAVVVANVGVVLADSPATSSSDGLAYPPGSFLLQAVALLIIIACVLAAFKFYTSIKGGRVGRGWMWVFCGLMVFAGAQLLLFGGQLGVLPLLIIWVDVLKVISLLLFFVGINQLRKIMA